MKYKFKKLDLSALPTEIHDDIDLECFLVKCSRVDSRRSLCVDFVDNIGVRNNEEVVENKGLSNTPVVHLGNDNLIWSMDDVCHNVVDGNGLEVVNCDDGGHGAEDVNWDDVKHRVESDEHVSEEFDRAKHPSVLPSSRLSRVSQESSLDVSEVELN